jgi:hypothetical protein
MSEATDGEIDSNGLYMAMRSPPFAVWLLLRHLAPFMHLHQLAQHPTMAPSHSRGGQGGSRLSKGAGGHAEEPWRYKNSTASRRVQAKQPITER